MTMLAGRYSLGDQIARGGTATVHHGDDEVLKRPVAIKFLTPDQPGDDNAPAAARREAVAGARLSHPRVARMLDYGEADWNGLRRPFLVMEFVPGETLRNRLVGHGPIPWREAARICADIGRALVATHAEHLVHRDVKPGNIMLSPSGAKVVDFGLAATVGDRTTDSAGLVRGTPGYFAPEQIRGARARPAMDVYALGLVLHACLTGRPAWSGASIDEVMTARVLSPVPRLPDSCDAPDHVRSIHRRCLAPLPRKRPSAGLVVRLLEDAAGPGRRRVAAPWGRGPSRIACGLRGNRAVNGISVSAPAGTRDDRRVGVVDQRGTQSV